MHRKMHKTLRKYKFIRSIRGDRGFDGACVCCYGSVFTPKNKKAKSCIYIKGQGSTRLILSNDYYKFLKHRGYMPMPC